MHFDLVYKYLFDAGDPGLPFTVMLVSAGPTLRLRWKRYEASVSAFTRQHERPI